MVCDIPAGDEKNDNLFYSEDKASFDPDLATEGLRVASTGHGGTINALHFSQDPCLAIIALSRCLVVCTLSVAHGIYVLF